MQPNTPQLANSQTPINQGNSLPNVNPDLASKVNIAPQINGSVLTDKSSNPTLPISNNIDSSFVQSLQTGTPASGLSSAPSLQQDVTTAQGGVDQTTQQIKELMGQLGYKSQDVSNLQSQANLTGLQGSLADLNTEFAQKKAEYVQKENQIAAQGIATPFKQGQLALARVQAQIELGSLSAQIQAAQGNLNTAFSTIDRTIEQKYKPIQDQIDEQLKYYDLNMDKLTVAQQKLATRQTAILEAQKTQIANEQNLTLQAQKDLQTQINSGLDTATAFQAMSDLLNKKISIGDFYTKIGMQNPNVDTSYGDAVIKNTLQLMGATTDMSVSQAITNLGMDKIVAGLITQEGGSPKGVVNNPGNIKFVGQKGATDSGVQATDGGTFASFPTKEAGEKAVADLVTKASNSGKDLSDFIASYKGVTPSIGTPDYKQYGLLADVPGFNPKNTVDKDAKAYLDSYIKNGKYPTYSSIFGRATGKNLSNTAQRAQDLFFQATGQSLPDVQLLKTNKALVSGNNKLANNLNIQEGTIAKNFQLAIENIDKAGINQSAQPINAFINTFKNLMGDPEVAQYLTQNTTIANEVGSLLALKNASGTTVADKLEATGLIPKNAGEKQQKAILKVLLQEAENAFETIKNTSGKLYKEIDPLETDPKNPNRIEKTQPKQDDFQTTPGGIKFKIVQ